MSAIVQLAIFELDDRQYGVRLESVDRVVRAASVTPLPQAPAIVMGAIDLHGTIVPVLSIRQRLGTAPRPIGLDDQLLIVRTSRRTVALAVDRVLNVISCPAERVIPAGAILPQWNEIEGAAQLDGGLTLIYDLDRFLSLQEDQTLENALQAHHGP